MELLPYVKNFESYYLKWDLVTLNFILTLALTTSRFIWGLKKVLIRISLGLGSFCDLCRLFLATAHGVGALRSRVQLRSRGCLWGLGWPLPLSPCCCGQECHHASSSGTSPRRDRNLLGTSAAPPRVFSCVHFGCALVG